jgi:translocation and assembly module TamB
VHISIDPLPIATVLARLQPNFGWGGDLAVGGHIDVHSEGRLAADIVIERSSGDLTVTDEVGTQALGLQNLRLALSAQDGVWTFSPYLSGQTLGVLAGAVVVRTAPEALWPEPQATLEGAMELEVANLGAWGTWVPAGWRLGGQLKTSALFGGRFGAPQFNGSVRGTGLGARNFVEGINVSDARRRPRRHRALHRPRGHRHAGHQRRRAAGRPALGEPETPGRTLHAARARGPPHRGQRPGASRPGGRRARSQG